MGGSGSGRWDGQKKKRTVESCTCLEVKPGRRITGTFQGGTWRMTMEKHGDATFLELRGYQNGWTAKESIELLHWAPNFGGKSFWLLCPHCGRKCRKLFAPPGTPSHRCRQCWDQTYESAQEAHRWDRGAAAALLAPLIYECGSTLREVEKVMRADFKAQRQEMKGK